MKYLSQLAFLFIFSSSLAQRPGGIAHNPRLWLQANSGVLTTVASNDVERWTDQSPFGNHALSTGSSPVFSTQTGDLLNYNPVVNFTSTNQDHLVIPNNLNILKSSNQNYTLFGVSRYQSGQMPYIGTQRSGSAPPQNAFQFGVRNAISSDVVVWRYNTVGCHHINGVVGRYPTTGVQRAAISGASRNGVTTFDYVNSRVGGSQICNQNFPNGLAQIGAGGGGGSGNVYSNQNMAEVIAFDRALSTADRNKVNSYLAVKYGITLDNAGGGTNGDYISSNNVVFWDASFGPDYHREVIGIGRDDATGLNQKQSHTADDSLRIYFFPFAPTNDQNTANIIFDNSYLMIGHNGGRLCSTPAANAEMPTGLPSCNVISRLEREWKVTNTMVNVVSNLVIKLDPCVSYSNFVTGALRILSDDDGNFANGGTTCHFGFPIFYNFANGVLTINNFPTSVVGTNETRFITIASVSNSTPLPIELLHFEAQPVEEQVVDLSWETATEVNTQSFTISRSQDLDTWETVAEVAAAGNSSTPQAYAIQDHQPFPGRSYYQLKGTDVDGTTSLETIREVELESRVLRLWPNPAQTQVELRGLESELEAIALYDATGQALPLRYLQQEKGRRTLDLCHLAPGLYLIKSPYRVYRLVKKK